MLHSRWILQGMKDLFVYLLFILYQTQMIKLRNCEGFFLHKSLTGFHLSCLLLCSWHVLPSSHELAYAREPVNGGICKLKWLIWENHGDVIVVRLRKRKRKEEWERTGIGGRSRAFNSSLIHSLLKADTQMLLCLCQRCSFSSVTSNTTELWELRAISL